MQSMKSNGLPMVSLLGHICLVLKRQLLPMPLMVLVLKSLTKSRSTTSGTPHIPLPQLVKMLETSLLNCALCIKRAALAKLNDDVKGGAKGRKKK